MIDLDAVQKRLAGVKEWDGALVNAEQLITEDVPGLVAELRAAREVVRTAEGLSQRWHDHINFEELGLDDDAAYEQVAIGMGTLRDRLAIYDRVAKP